METRNIQLPISAIVVSCNEGHYLKTCLNSLWFCHEIILIDLESTDTTSSFKTKEKVKYFVHEKVPIVENIREWAISLSNNDWILFVDPDEEYDPSLIQDIVLFFESKKIDSTSIISLPYQYYYKSVKLKGTIWGGVRYIDRLIHKSKSFPNANVHLGFSSLPASNRFQLKKRKGANNFIHHYWMSDKDDFIYKHKRYIDAEGKSLYSQGKDYNIALKYYHTIASFCTSFIVKRGFLDGILGFKLSLFYAWYTYKKWESLQIYQKKKSPIQSNSTSIF